MKSLLYAFGLALGGLLLIGLFVKPQSIHKQLVHWRNQMLFQKYSAEAVARNQVVVPLTQRQQLKQVFGQLGLETWEDLFNYRRAHFNWGALSDKVVISQLAADCLHPRRQWDVCNCSDLARLVMAFCAAQNQSCSQIIKGTEHTYVYNRDRHQLMDLFLGYTFDGDVEDLYAALNSGASLVEDKRFVDLGQTLGAANFKRLQQPDFRQQIYQQTLQSRVSGLGIQAVHQMTEGGFLFPWEQLLPYYVGQPDGLQIYRYQYFWQGEEWLLPVLELSRGLGSDHVGYLAAKNGLSLLYSRLKYGRHQGL